MAARGSFGGRLKDVIVGRDTKPLLSRPKGVAGSKQGQDTRAGINMLGMMCCRCSLRPLGERTLQACWKSHSLGQSALYPKSLLITIRSMQQPSTVHGPCY